MLGLKDTLKGKNKWCGPAALAAVLNTDTDTAARLIRRRSGQTAVKYSYLSDIVAVMQDLGGQVQSKPMRGQVVWQVARGCPLTVMRVTLDGSGHFILVRKGKVLDNHTKTWVKIADHPSRNAPITNAYQINVLPKMPKPVRPKRMSRAEVKQINARNACVQAKWIAQYLETRLDQPHEVERCMRMLDELAAYIRKNC